MNNKILYKSKNITYQEIKVINLNSHYYCNLIRDSLPQNSEYILLNDFDIRTLLVKINYLIRYRKLIKTKNINGWGESSPINLIKISLSLLKNSPIFSKKKVFLITHRIFDHLFFVLLAILLRIKPITIFHGRCENSTVKIIYKLKYFTSGIYFLLERIKLIHRYFIHGESKLSYFGKTGIIQKPTVINSMGIRASYKNNGKSLIVCNYPERPYFSKTIFLKSLKNKEHFLFYGASNKYSSKSLTRNELKEKYKNSLAYVSILIEPENYYSLTLLDACDARLPLICLKHRFMSEKFKKHVIVYSNYQELEYQIKKLKENKSHWEKYSELSYSLLEAYFSKSNFINTWRDLINAK